MRSELADIDLTPRVASRSDLRNKYDQVPRTDPLTKENAVNDVNHPLPASVKDACTGSGTRRAAIGGLSCSNCPIHPTIRRKGY